MLRAFDPKSDWDLPSDCATTLVDNQCPEGSVIRAANYPDALRHFLAAQGYISR